MAGVDAFGTQFKRGDGGGPEVFTAVANVTKITPPAIKRETLDVTAHDSPNAWMEFLGGLKDGGEVSIEVNYNPGLHDAMLADLDDDEPRNYQIVFPDALSTTWDFAAILTSYAPDAAPDAKMTAKIGFKVSGEPSFS